MQALILVACVLSLWLCVFFVAFTLSFVEWLKGMFDRWYHRQRTLPANVDLRVMASGKTNSIVVHKDHAHPKQASVSNRLIRPPGSRLYALAVFFYSKKTITGIFDPMIADMRDEYFEALSKGEHWKARWVRLAYYWAFVKAVGLFSLVSLAKKVIAMWKLLP